MISGTKKCHSTYQSRDAVEYAAESQRAWDMHSSGVVAREQGRREVADIVTGHEETAECTAQVELFLQRCDLWKNT